MAELFASVRSDSFLREEREEELYLQPIFKREHRCMDVGEVDSDSD
jgi:hypothetical protein